MTLDRCQLLDLDTPGLRCREDAEVVRALICAPSDSSRGQRQIRQLAICGPHDVVLQAQALCAIAAGEPFMVPS